MTTQEALRAGHPLRITSGDRPHQTQVHDAVTGELLTDVLSFDIHLDPMQTTATIRVYDPVFDVTVLPENVTIETEPERADGEQLVDEA